MKRVLWLSKYDLTYKQSEDLKRILNDEIEIFQEKSILSIEDIVDRSKDYDILAVVLPVSVISDIFDEVNIPIFRSVMKKVHNDGKTILTHDYWEEIIDIKFVTEKYYF